MPMYNFLEYSDNYEDSSGSLWQFKRDEQNMTDARNPDNVTRADSSFFEYKSSLLRNLVTADVAAVGDGAAAGGAYAYRILRNEKIAVPLKYLSNFFGSLEMSLINCKIHLELS